LKGGRKVVGKNGTATAATTTAAPARGHGGLGPIQHALQAAAVARFSQASTLVSPWSRFFIRGSR
jgi:hypothetical protein